MKLSLLTENLNQYVYGYRSFSAANNIDDLKKLLIRDAHIESYFSPYPMYYYNNKAKDGNTYTNLVEIRFDKRDTSFGGFGDSQPFYAGLVATPKTGDIPYYEFIETLPSELQKEYRNLATTIKTDPRYKEDWLLAGCLPKDLKIMAANLFRKCRTHSEKLAEGMWGEINYLGSITSFGAATGTTVTAMVIAKQMDLKYHPETIVQEWHSKDTHLMGLI